MGLQAQLVQAVLFHHVHQVGHVLQVSRVILQIQADLFLRVHLLVQKDLGVLIGQANHFLLLVLMSPVFLIHHVGRVILVVHFHHGDQVLLVTLQVPQDPLDQMDQLLLEHQRLLEIPPLLFDLALHAVLVLPFALQVLQVLQALVNLVRLFHLVVLQTQEFLVHPFLPLALSALVDPGFPTLLLVPQVQLDQKIPESLVDQFRLVGHLVLMDRVVLKD